MSTRKPYRALVLLDKLLSYEGIDDIRLKTLRSYWLIIKGISIFVTLMLIPAIHFQVHSLLLFGILLLSVYVPTAVLMLIFPYRRDWIRHLGHHLQLIITFYTIVRLGGIPNSGGIILAALGMVITSLSFQKISWTLWYFSFYFLCTISVAVIQLVVNMPPEMPSHVNHIFFLMNSLTLSAYCLFMVLMYLRQRTHAEKEKVEQLQELNETKSRLYANITHEFRTPLTVILGQAEELQSRVREAHVGGTGENQTTWKTTPPPGQSDARPFEG